VSWLDSPLVEYPAGSLLGYLIGAIPFGYLVFRWAKGVDIRTVGSKNIGATNVGRLLGFRFFLLVFACDVLKGFLPTVGIPLALGQLGNTVPADLAVFVGLATILGHNFPVYLGFKGGKGVATSLGALLALDPIACAASAAGFFLVFLCTRYVSLSSIAGALAFVVGHFAHTAEPWSRENRAMSTLSIVISALLIIRHHANIRRVLAGTEPKVPLRGSRSAEPPPTQSSGRIHPHLLLGLAAIAVLLLGSSAWVVHRARTPIEASAGPWHLRETHREVTGQQRATRVLFADHGRTLAVMCPRYNKVLLYRVSANASLVPAVEITLAGRPVALAAASDQLFVLQRPLGDDKHLGPGWWQAFDLDGHPCGDRVAAGYYPDDLAVTPDGRLLIVLSSGQGEGDRQKPLPCIEVFQTQPPSSREPYCPISRLSLEPSDDPERLFVSESGRRALITIPGARQSLAVDLSRPDAPRRTARQELGGAPGSYLSVSPDADLMIMPSLSACEAVALEAPGKPRVSRDGSPPARYLIYTRPDDSVLEIVQSSPMLILGRFPIRGPLNLAGTRPSGLALSSERGLLAVTTKPGTVHLISIRSRLEPDPTPERRRLAEAAEPVRR
jgi:glycerol-3-phosphate acyltransferase PlsY